MRPRTRLHGSILALPLLGALGLGSAFAAERPERPNVLFIAVDDLKPLLGCYGAEQIHSPNIDRLAARGTVFLNNQCQQAVCGPSRACVLTGLRPDTTGVFDLKTRARDINPDLVTLPQYFRQNGYATHAYGKIEDPRTFNDGTTGRGSLKYDPPSWDSYDRVDVGGQTGTDANGQRYPTWAEDVPDNAYADGMMADLAIERLTELAAEDAPFFLAVGFKKPHLPFVAPQKYWDLYDRATIPVEEWQTAPEGAPEYAMHNSSELRTNYGGGVPASGPFPEDMQRELNHGYRACVSYIDAQVGRLLDQMESLGVSDNTIIVLWGDHGFHLGDHGLYCKHSNFEQAARSPLIVSAPWQESKGTSTTSPSEFVDVFPTLCDLANLPLPADLEGASLVPLLQDPARVVKMAAISQYPRGGGASQKMGYSYRSPRYRFTAWTPFEITDRTVVDRELYDYVADPEERRNLADDPAYAHLTVAFEQLHHAGWRALQADRIPAILLDHTSATTLPDSLIPALETHRMNSTRTLAAAATVVAALATPAATQPAPGARKAAAPLTTLTQSFALPAGPVTPQTAGLAVESASGAFTIEQTSLAPSNPVVAAKLAPSEGGSLKVAAAGETTNLRWAVEGVSNKTSTVYYSFLLRPEALPYNGEVVGFRRHKTGGGTCFQLRGDMGAAKGGTQKGQASAFSLRPNSSDTPGVAGTTPTMSLDGTKTYFVVVKCEAAPDFGASGETAAMRMTTWLDPDPSGAETGAAVWQSATENGPSPSNIQWFSVGAHKERASFIIDEVRIGATWEAVTPTR